MIDSVTFIPTPFEKLPGWKKDSVKTLRAPLLQSLRIVSQNEHNSHSLKQLGLLIKALEQTEIITSQFLEAWFQPHEIISKEGGFFTGYYEPEIKASLKKGGLYQTPIYGVPSDLLFIKDLGAFNQRLTGERLAARQESGEWVPYYTRSDIYNGVLKKSTPVIAWAADRIDLFFVEIQGSGVLVLDNGQKLRIGYKATNGRPYTAIGKVLYEQGVLSKETLTMEGIQSYLRTLKAEELEKILSQNESYVFFETREGQAPLGTLGVELVPERSLAVDPRYVLLGLPVWISCLHPVKDAMIEKLMIAHDTGGAIKGAARGDFYWGTGKTAGVAAGKMKSPGKMYVFLLKEDISV